jgi:MFS family permease
MMFLAFAMSALVYSGKLVLWHVFAIGVVTGVVIAFDLPASQAMPPELVAPPDIPNAVGLMQAVFHGARLVGPAIAGVLMARLGRGSAFFANGVSFLAVIATLVVIRPHVAKAGGWGKGSGKIGEAFDYLREDRVSRALIVLTALITGFVFPFMAVLMVYYVRYQLGSSDAQVMGWLMSASGLGSLVGAGTILTGSAGARRNWLAFGVVGVATALVGMSVSRALYLVIPFVSLLAFSTSGTMGRISQMIQERVPPQLRGRVMGVFSMSFTGVMPFAALTWSWLVDRMASHGGYARVMEAAAALFLVSATWVLRTAWSELSVAPSTAPANAAPT